VSRNLDLKYLTSYYKKCYYIKKFLCDVICRDYLASLIIKFHNWYRSIKITNCYCAEAQKKVFPTSGFFLSKCQQSCYSGHLFTIPIKNASFWLANFAIGLLSLRRQNSVSSKRKGFRSCFSLFYHMYSVQYSKTGKSPRGNRKRSNPAVKVLT